MGLFDVFSKGGKYFGKAIEPKCEYCEYGKRTTDGDKVLCTKKGMVEASFHCPKFLYSPLKRIPVKQMKMVGFLEGDYDEKDDDELAKKAAERKAAEDAAKASAPAAPAPAAPVLEKPAAPAAPATPAAPKPAAPKPASSDALAALAAMADAAGEYAPDAADAPKNDDDSASGSAGAPDPSILSSM